MKILAEPPMFTPSGSAPNVYNIWLRPQYLQRLAPPTMFTTSGSAPNVYNVCLRPCSLIPDFVFEERFPGGLYICSLVSHSVTCTRSSKHCTPLRLVLTNTLAFTSATGAKCRNSI